MQRIAKWLKHIQAYSDQTILCHLILIISMLKVFNKFGTKMENQLKLPKNLHIIIDLFFFNKKTWG